MRQVMRHERTLLCIVSQYCSEIAVLFTMSANGYVVPARQGYDIKYLSENLPISLDKLSVLHIELVGDTPVRHKPPYGSFLP